jgi:resuscitation-promoting factor RpfA
MAKSRDAFRTISEVSDWLDTPAHVLRFWESRFSQIKPIKRAGGRRYYRPNDMLLLGGIKRLLHDDGLTIKGVQKILREKGLKYVSSLSHELDETADAAPEATPIEAIVDAAPEVFDEVETGRVEQDPAESIEMATEPEKVADIATPDIEATQPADEPTEDPHTEPEEPIDNTPEITISADDDIPSGDRLSVLYHDLKALRDRVQAQIQAA